MAERPGGESQSSDLDNVFIRLPTNFAAMDLAASTLPSKKGLSKRLTLVLIFLLLIILIPTAFYILKVYLSKPQIYSVVTFNTDKSQIVKSGSTLAGKGIQNTKTELFISPGQISQKLTNDKDGNWSYKLPNNLKTGTVYKLTIIIFDRLDKISDIQSYKLKIQNPSLFGNINLFNIPKALAQEALSREESDWVVQMRQLGVWPAKENGEFVLYSEQEWEKRYCPKPCAKMSRQPSIGDQIKSLSQSFKATNNNDITQALIKKLQLRGYAPLPVLTQYIPELDNEQAQRDYAITKAFSVDAKREISEQDLRDVLNEVFKEKLDYQLKGGSVGTLIDLAGLRTVLNVFTNPSHHKLEYLGQDEALELMLGLLIVYEPAQGAVRLSGQAVRIAPELLEDIPTIIRLLRSGRPVLVRALRDQSARWVVKSAEEAAANEGAEQIISRSSRWAKEFDNLPGAAVYDLKGLSGFDLFKSAPMSSKGTYWYIKMIDPGMKAKKISQISTTHVLNPAGDRLLSVVRDFYNRTGRSVELSQDFFRVVQNGKAFVVDDDFFTNVWLQMLKEGGSTSSAVRPGLIPGGVASGDLVILRRSEYEQVSGLSTLYHELVHTISADSRTFSYGAPDELNRALSMIYELMTDVWLNPIYGVKVSSKTPLVAGSYVAENPEVAYALFQRIVPAFRRTGANPVDSLLDFAISGNSDRLILDLTGKSGGEGQKLFLEMLDKLGIRYQRVQYVANSIAKYSPYAVVTVGGVEIAYIAVNSRELTEKLSAKEREIAQNVLNIFLDKDKTFISPTIQITSDILDNNYDSSYTIEPKGDVSILSVSGDYQQGNTIQVSTIIHEYGEDPQDVSKYQEVWTLNYIGSTRGGAIHVKQVQASESPETLPQSIGDVKTLPGGEACSEQCSLTIPIDIVPGEYKLTVYLLEKGSDKILNADSYPIIIKKAPKRIKKITFNNQELDLLNPISSIHLPGTISQAQGFDLPLVIEYSDGSNKYLSYHINYQPKANQSPSPEESTINQEQQPTQEEQPTQGEQSTPQVPEGEHCDNVGDYDRVCLDNEGTYKFRQCQDNNIWSDWLGSENNPDNSCRPE